MSVKIVTQAVMVMLFVCLAPVRAAENDEILFNRVHLQASAQRDIENDLLEVTLAVEVQGTEPARIAGRVNEAMEWALQRVGTREDIEARTLSYRTWPVYRDQVVAAWRASQQLLLRSRHIAELSQLVGTLQERLQVKQMHFSVSPSARRQAENALIDEAMESFKQRLMTVGGHMQGSDYRIVDLHINTGQPSPVIYQERAMAMTTRDATPPAVEAGTSEITVTVSGSVQFY